MDQPLVGGGEAKKGAEKKKRPRKNSSRCEFVCFYWNTFSIFSDFESLAASVPMPPVPQFPIPPYPLSQLTRDQVVKHARNVLKHISPAGMEIGSGNSLSWKERFPTSIISPKIKNLVGSSVETVSPSDFRLDNDNWNGISLQPRSIYVPSLAVHPRRPGSHQQNLWHFNANYYQGHSVTHATFAYTSLMWPWSSQMAG